MSDLQKAAPVKIKQGGVAVGSYSGIFQGAYKLPPRTDGGEDYGPALILKWKTDDGLEPTTIVSEQPTLKNRAGKLLSAMLGRQLSPNETVDYGQFEGDRHTVIVTTNKAGTGTCVTEVIPQ